MSKTPKYKEVAAQISAIIDGEPNRIARYASAVCVLSQAFDYYFWTGFYIVDPDKSDELVIGPYQGTLGCLRIAFGRGVCGTAARERKTIIVEDVHEFPGHIACDVRSNSEIVVPVFDDNATLAAVLDVDSLSKGSFDARDKVGLENICQTLLSGT